MSYNDPISEAVRRAAEAAARPRTYKENQPQRYQAWLDGVAAQQQQDADYLVSFWRWAKRVGLPTVKLGTTGLFRGWPIGVSDSAGSYETTVSDTIYVTRGGRFRYRTAVRAGGRIGGLTTFRDSPAVIANYLGRTGYIDAWMNRR